MAISRMQEPRQLYGLGSFVKSIGKTVKKIVKSPIGKAALIGAAAFGIPGTQFGGLLGRASLGGAAPSIFGKTGGISALLGQKAMTTAPYAKATGLQKFLGRIPGGGYTVGAIGSILAASGMSPEEIEETRKDPEKVRVYLKDYYSKTNPDASDEEIEEFVRVNTAEYAVGGRVGLESGTPKKGLRSLQSMPMGQIRMNRAGTIERDYRETGGFVPVGIKEKADDVPAMLSKNEFVMTADAVRGAGDGSIEKGAQRMYDQMKRLENKVA